MLAFHSNAIQFAADKMICNLPVGALADDDAATILLGHTLQARSQIDVVSHDRPCQSLGRSHVPDIHRAGVHTDSDGDFFPPFCLPLCVELLQAMDHFESASAGTHGMVAL